MASKMVLLPQLIRPWAQGARLKAAGVPRRYAVRAPTSASTFQGWGDLADGSAPARDDAPERPRAPRPPREEGRRDDGGRSFRDSRGGGGRSFGGPRRGGPISRDSRPNVRPGDWACPSCRANNYASRELCFRCEEPRGDAPSEVGNAPRSAPTMKPGDWTCPDCSFANFASRDSCRQCQAPRGDTPGFEGAPSFGERRDAAPRERSFAGRRDSAPRSFGGGRRDSAPSDRFGGARPEDWSCPSCSFSNFASRRECFKCQTPKP